MTALDGACMTISQETLAKLDAVIKAKQLLCLTGIIQTWVQDVTKRGLLGDEEVTALAMRIIHEYDHTPT